MKDEEILYCLIAFILGWLASRHMGNGFSVGGDDASDPKCPENLVSNSKPCEKVGRIPGGAKNCGRWFGLKNGKYYVCKDAKASMWHPFTQCNSSNKTCDPHADPFADYHPER
jgi:hypothetical protein